MIVKRLMNGAEVKLRPVPPHVRSMMASVMLEGLPPEPEIPEEAARVLTSADGHTEKVGIDTDSVAYKDYLQEHRKWDRERRRLQSERGLDNMIMMVEYTIVSWRFSRFGLWLSNPLPWWKLPLSLGFASTKLGRRADFIMTELLQYDDDLATITDIATGADLTRREVESAADGFRPDEGDEQGAG